MDFSVSITTRKTLWISTLLGIALMSTACSPEVNFAATANPTSTAASTMAATPTVPTTPTEVESEEVPTLLAPAPEETPIPVTPSPIGYQIKAALDYNLKSVRVDQIIRITGMLAGLNEMALIVEANRYYSGFELHALEVNQGLVHDFTLTSNQLRFSLPEAAGMTGDAQIHLDYTINLPAIPPPSEMFKPQPYGFTERQINLVDWYPFVPPLDGQNQWVIHNPPIFGESLVYPVADHEVELIISGNHLPLTVAASGMAERSENLYRFKTHASRNFAISISPYYRVLEGEAKGVKILTYAFDGYEAQNAMVLQNAVEAVNLFSELYGLLPQASVSVVQADFLDGMEFDGLYFLSKGFYDLYDGTVKGYLSLIAVHEMAHQWWYGAVGNDQAQEPWLDEALCTFAELQYMERYYPDLAGWWWIYRVDIYDPVGPIDGSIYTYPSYVSYRNAVYLQGAHFLADLREAMGEEAFMKGLKRYYSENLRRIATREDFFAVFEFNLDDLQGQVSAKYFSAIP